MTLTLLPSPGRARDQIGTVLDVRVLRAEAARTVVALRGEADRSTTAILSDALSRMVASRAGDVVIDLGQLEFVDTATVRVIATAHDLLGGQGRTLTVRSPSRLAIRVLDLFGLAELIEGPETTQL
jgi:anti-anti-sigma factor